MYIFINGFWPGFIDKRDAVDFSVFEYILTRAFEQPIHLTDNFLEADILLESHFSQSILFIKQWKYSFFFSAEGDNFSIPPHSENYTVMLGSQRTKTNFVSMPLYLLYDFCRPFQYPDRIQSIPPKAICALITHCKEEQYRVKFIQKLEEIGIHVDMAGSYKNNIGYKVPGTYGDPPMVEFQKQYRIVLALENTVLDDYITEKIINPLRAGVVPIYYGSPRLNEYIHTSRCIQTTPDTFNETVNEIHRLLTNDSYWLEKVNQPRFIKSTHDRLDLISKEIQILLTQKSYFVELISNYSVETDRHETIDSLSTFFKCKPTFECWKNTVDQHPLFTRFSLEKSMGNRSLAINHITLFKKYVNKNKYLVVLESDAIPNQPLSSIEESIQKTILYMNHFSIDSVFLGCGCFLPLTQEQVANVNKIGENLIIINQSRCTESYIISPNGMEKFLKWFYSKMNHVEIDWMFNNLFNEVSCINCWHYPELFYQGSEFGKYKSSVFKLYIRNPERCDGFGAQFQNIIWDILFAEHNDMEFTYYDIKRIEHNYTNDPTYINKLIEFTNIRKNYKAGEVAKKLIYNDKINDELLYKEIEKDINRYHSGPPFEKLKKTFYEGKINPYSSDYIHCAVHIRRPNQHDGINSRTNVSLQYYKDTIKYVRKTYTGNKPLWFHIYSQGKLEDFLEITIDRTSFYLDGEVSDALLGFVFADILIISASSLSYSAALLSNGRIITPRFWHPPLKLWEVMEFEVTF